MNEIPAIDEDPSDILMNPDFHVMRIDLLHSLTNSVNDTDLHDAIERILYRQAGPKHIFPALPEGRCCEDTGRVDLQFRIPFNYETAEILHPPFSGPVPTLDPYVGLERSTPILNALPLAQRILATHYAFASRYNELMIEKQEMEADEEMTGKLFDTIASLSRAYERYMHKLMRGDS